MKKLTLLVAVILVSFLSSCNTTDYNRELLDNISAWNTYTRQMEGILDRAFGTEDKEQYSYLKLNTDDIKKNIDKRISELEAKNSSDEDVKKLDAALIDYLKSERATIEEGIVVLYEKGANMTDEELNTLFEKINSLVDVSVEKGDALREVQDKYAAKHNITIEEHK